MKVYIFLPFCGISAQATTVSMLIYHVLVEIKLCEILLFSDKDENPSTQNSSLVFNPLNTELNPICQLYK